MRVRYVQVRGRRDAQKVRGVPAVSLPKRAAGVLAVSLQDQALRGLGVYGFARTSARLDLGSGSIVVERAS
jgi:hypothetical protein